MKAIKQWLARRRLAKITKPDPQFRKRRLAQLRRLGPERVDRYFANVKAAGL